MWVGMCAVATTERVTVCSHLVDTPVLHTVVIGVFRKGCVEGF